MGNMVIIMINLLRSDLYKLKHSTTFKVCLIVIVAVCLLGTIFINLSIDILEQFMGAPDFSDPSSALSSSFATGFQVGYGTVNDSALEAFEGLDFDIDFIRESMRGPKNLFNFLQSTQFLGIIMSIFSFIFITSEFFFCNSSKCYL